MKNIKIEVKLKVDDNSPMTLSISGSKPPGCTDLEVQSTIIGALSDTLSDVFNSQNLNKHKW